MLENGPRDDAEATRRGDDHAAGTLTAQGDWAGTPATKGDLMLLRANVESKIKDVEGKIKDVRVELGEMIGDVRSEVGDLRREVAKLRVSMAWMTLGVTTVLGGLITLFQFLS